MSNAYQELIKWLEDRIEYYKYEYRYSNSDKAKETIETKMIKAKEILQQVEKAYSFKPLNTQVMSELLYNRINSENE